MNTSRKIDMTKGPIMPSIMLFALPIIAGNILQYLYTTVDTLVIGNYCDHAAIAAVGTSAQPVEMFLCVFIGVGTGVSILVSQHVGAGDLPGIRNTCRTAVTFVYMCGIPVSIAGFFLAPLILRLMGVPSDVWDNAILYTRIVLMSASPSLSPSGCFACLPTISSLPPGRLLWPEPGTDDLGLCLREFREGIQEKFQAEFQGYFRGISSGISGGILGGVLVFP